MTGQERAERVAEVFSMHPGVATDVDGVWRCNGLLCGWSTADQYAAAALHREHVATAVLAALGDDAQTGPMVTPDRETLAAHEPVLGLFVGQPGIVGCSCLSARDYRAAGYCGGQQGWRDHLIASGAVITAADAARAWAEDGAVCQGIFAEAIWLHKSAGIDQDDYTAVCGCGRKFVTAAGRQQHAAQEALLALAAALGGES